MDNPDNPFVGQDGDRMVSRHLRRGAVKTRGPPAGTLRAGHGLRTIRRGLRRQTLQEGARPVDGAGLQLRRILPGKHRDLRIRRQLARKHLDKIDEALK